jgi:hypothetical protein
MICDGARGIRIRYLKNNKDADLKVPEPDFGVKERKREYMVNKRLGFSGCRGYTKYLPNTTVSLLLDGESLYQAKVDHKWTYMCEEFLCQASPFSVVKGTVETD